MVRARTERRRVMAFIGAIATAAAVAVAPTGAQQADASSTTPVMQQSRLSGAQIAAFFKASTRSPYNATVSIDTLASYYVSEGASEGVAGDIAFAQAIVETGWFSFPAAGQVRGHHNNFAGMGAYDGSNGTYVFQFPNARVGVRAQLHHLRVYADPNVNTTGSNLGSVLARDVDNRYPDRWRWVRNAKSGSTHLYWARARNWEDFGGGLWATDPAYSRKVLDVYARMLSFNNVSQQPQGAVFSDVPASSTFAADIARIAAADITRGCGGSRYCPKQVVTREQMASFIVRATGLEPSNADRFKDVASSNPHRRDINALAAAGVAMGCNPPDNDRFCPKGPVTREQMASFLVRARKWAPLSGSTFSDVPASNPHRNDINRLATRDVTRGCNPPSNSRFCPKDRVTREQMAAFLNRAFL